MLGAIVMIGTATYAVVAESAAGRAVVPIVHASRTTRFGDMALQSWIPGFRYPVAQCAAAKIVMQAGETTGNNLTAEDLAICQEMASRAALDRQTLARYRGTTAWNLMARNERCAI